MGLKAQMGLVDDTNLEVPFAISGIMAARRGPLRGHSCLGTHEIWPGRPSVA